MSDKDPQWPGPDGKPGVSFASKGSRKQRNQARGTQQKQLPPPGKADTAATTNLARSEAPTTAKQLPPAAARPGAQPSPPPPSQPKAQAQTQPKVAPQPVSQPKPAAQPAAKESGGGAAGGAVWSTPPAAAPAPLTPLPAPDGSSGRSSVKKPSKEAKSSEGKQGLEATKGGGRKTRRARLRLSRIDPWSVMKTSFLFSIAFGIILVVVVAVLWRVIEGSGALDSINSTMNQLIGDANTKFTIQTYISSGRVVGLAALLAAVDVVILTAVATLFAFLYNLAATAIGGLEITLAED